MKTRKSKLRSNIDLLKVLVQTEPSMAAILKGLGMTTSPGNYDSLKKVCKEYNLVLPDGSGTARASAAVRKPLTEILVEHSTYTSTYLKIRLIREGLLQEVCAECNIDPIWQGLPLVLQLDHINGVHDDNRIENLRFLCPNCHSQTETFCKGTLWRNKGVLV